MTITYFANYVDPTIIQFCETMVRLTDNQFLLVATEPFPDELRSYGYKDLNKSSFVECLYKENEPLKKAWELAENSDVLIYGHCPVEYFNLCVKTGKPVFRMSQHIYRDGDIDKVPLKWKLSYFLKHTVLLLNKPVYLMCLGTYTARDFALTHSYHNKMYEFGVFPQFTEVYIESLLQAKKTHPVKLLWVNKFHEWYHPEYCIELMERLKDSDVTLTMSGKGELSTKIKQSISDSALQDKIEIIEDSSKELDDKLFEESNIFLLTSDHNEGWGANMNRAMNYGCVPVVSNAVGGAKIIRQGENGYLYRNGDIEDLFQKVFLLCENREKMICMGNEAYETVKTEWNGMIGADRFNELINSLLGGKGAPFSEGLCSKARIVSQLEMDQRCLCDKG